MNLNEDQSTTSRDSSGPPVHRKYQLRNCDKKIVYAYDDLTDVEEDLDKPTLSPKHSWCLDNRTNDSDPGYSSSELTGRQFSEKCHSNYVPVKSKTNTETQALKVILKRSYSDKDKDTSFGSSANSEVQQKCRRGRSSRQSVVQSQIKHTGKSNIQHQYLAVKETSSKPFLTSSRTVHKKHSNPEFWYGEEFNFVTELDTYEPAKVHVPTEAKDTLEKQVLLKRRLSSDSTKGISESAKRIPTKIHAPVDKDNTKNSEGTYIVEVQTSDTSGYPKFNKNCSGSVEETACHLCALSRQIDDSKDAGTSSHRTININRCLNWTYQLSKTEWLDYSNSLFLLKLKYPVLKILFKSIPVIHLDRLKQTELNDLQRNCTYMTSKPAISNTNEKKNNLVDPKVVSLSKSLLSNGTGKTGIDKIFSKAKGKPLKKSKGVILHTVTKYSHDMNFKLKLKEACKPKLKKMAKNIHNNNCARDLSVYKPRVSHQKVITESDNGYVNENVNNDKESGIREIPYQESVIGTDYDRMSNLYPNMSRQPCSTSSCKSPQGSPGPPHLEKEFIRKPEDEIEILKMNDFEIEICRDDIDESMPEVLDMRIGVRGDADTTKHSDSGLDVQEDHCLDKDEAVQAMLPRSSCNSHVDTLKVDSDTGSTPSMDSYISRLSFPENLEVNVDHVSAADVNAYNSPSNLVIQSVCSLNQDYNNSAGFVMTEPSMYNQKILEMLDGEIFQTNMSDPKPLDLVKATKQSLDKAEIVVSEKQQNTQYTSDSDETFVYSDASEEALELNSESQTYPAKSEMSPRQKALKSTKSRISLTPQDLTNNDSLSLIPVVSDTQDHAHDNIGHPMSNFRDSDAKMTATRSEKEGMENISNMHHAVKDRKNKNPDLLVMQNDPSFGVRNTELVTEVKPADTDFKVRHVETDLVTFDKDESNLVISETSNETETIQESRGIETSDKEGKQQKTGKSPSFAKNLGKNKQLRDFMTKEKERRKPANKENGVPKLNRSRKASSEDLDELPQILPPKRRQRTPKSQSKEDSSDANELAANERIMAEFPKHNWLFSKYNNVKNGDSTNRGVNKQAENGSTDAMTSPMTSSLTSSTSLSAGSTACTPVNQQAAGKQILTGHQPVSQKHDTLREEVVGFTGVNMTQINLNKVSRTAPGNSNLINNSAVAPRVTCSLPVLADVASTLASKGPSPTPWLPVRDHDPTLASVTLDNSPESLLPCDEIDTGDRILNDKDSLPMTAHLSNLPTNEETVVASAMRLNLVSRDPCSSKPLNKTLQMFENKCNFNHGKNEVNPSQSFQINTATTQYHTDKSQENTDRRQFNLDKTQYSANGTELIKEKTELTIDTCKDKSSCQGNPLTSATKAVTCKPYTSSGYTVANTSISEYQLSALRPETIQALKIGNPALVNFQFRTPFQTQSQATVQNTDIVRDNKIVNDSCEIDKLSVSQDKSAIKQGEKVSLVDEMKKNLDQDRAVIANEDMKKQGDTVLKEDQNVNPQDSALINGSDCGIQMIYDKEKLNLPDSYISGQSRPLSDDNDREDLELNGSKMEEVHFPLNMSKDSSTCAAEKVETGKSCDEKWSDEMAVWTAEPTSEISLDSSMYETDEMALPLDLCINRSVTENSFACYRKHHPPPVQMVHPQIKKPSSSETVSMTRVTVNLQEETVEAEPKDEDDEESALLIDESDSNETSSQNEQNSNENAVHLHESVGQLNLNVEADIRGKVSELPSSVPTAALVSTEEICQSQVMATSSGKVIPNLAPVPAMSSFIRPAPVVSQYRPVVVRPVQQVSLSPRQVSVPAQVIQPVVTVHSISHAAAKAIGHPQIVNNQQFSTNIIQQTRMLGNNYSFNQNSQVNPPQHLNSAGQHQSNFGNIQLVTCIPAGQILVPLQSQNTSPVIQTNNAPVVQAFQTNGALMLHKSRRTTKKILPKQNEYEVPSKKVKTNQEEAGFLPVSVSEANVVGVDYLKSANGSTMEVDTTVHSSLVVAPDESKHWDKNEINVEKDSENKEESNGSLSEGSEDLKKGDSSDEMMDEDEELKNEMEEYRKLKEERKRKEKEEMEMRRKIIEKMKLAKAKKPVSIKLRKNTQNDFETKSDMKSNKDSSLSSENCVFETISSKAKCPSNEISINDMVDKDNKGQVNCESVRNILDEDSEPEIIAEWNLPTTSDSAETFSNKNVNYTPIVSGKDEYIDEQKTESLGSNCVGLDLRIDQHSFKSTKTAIDSKKSSDNDLLNLSSIRDTNQQINQIHYEEGISQDNVSNVEKIATSISKDTSVCEHSSSISTSEVMENDMQCHKHSAEVNATSVSFLASALCGTYISGVSGNPVKSVSGNPDKTSNILTTIEIEQRPYSPPILTPRPIVGLQNRNILSSLEHAADSGNQSMLKSTNGTSSECNNLTSSYQFSNNTSGFKQDNYGECLSANLEMSHLPASGNSSETSEIQTSTCDASLIRNANLDSKIVDNESTINFGTDCYTANADVAIVSDVNKICVDLSRTSNMNRPCDNVSAANIMNRSSFSMSSSVDANEGGVDMSRTSSVTRESPEVIAVNHDNNALNFKAGTSETNVCMTRASGENNPSIDISVAANMNKESGIISKRSDLTCIEDTGLNSTTGGNLQKFGKVDDDKACSGSSPSSTPATENYPFNGLAEMATVELDLSRSSCLTNVVTSSISPCLSSSLIETISSIPCSLNALDNHIFTTTGTNVISSGNDMLCAVSSSSAAVIMSVAIQSPAAHTKPSIKVNCLADFADAAVSIPVPDASKTIDDIRASNSSINDISGSTSISFTSAADAYTTAMDYSSKTLSSINNHETECVTFSSDALSNYKCLNVTQRRPCSIGSSNTSVYKYTSSNSNPISISYSGCTKLSSALQERLSRGQRMVECPCEIPLAHTKPKPEKIRKRSKPPVAHTHNGVTSLKSLIKKMNRTVCQIPIQIQQSCPFFKRALQYNWSPSPKDTYRSKIARRETPIPIAAHNQKPFGIAGKLIIPAGRFNRKRCVGREMAYSQTRTQNVQTDRTGSFGSKQLLSPSDSKSYQKKQLHAVPMLPPIRAHIQLDGDADTVTITNVQNPDLMGNINSPVTKQASNKPVVVDLTCDDKDMFNRDIQLDESEKQIQHELSEAVAKRQKLEFVVEKLPMQGKTLEPGEIKNITDSNPNNVAYNQEWEDNAVRRQKRRTRSQSFSYPTSSPVQPTYYQIKQNGQSQSSCPPNFSVRQNCSPAVQEQPRQYLDVELGSTRTTRQWSHGDVQPFLHVSNQRQTENRVPPLVKMRDTRIPQPIMYPNQQEPMTVRSPTNTGYPNQSRTLLRAHGGPGQQMPGLVNHYLVPPRQALHSPGIPTQRMGGPVVAQQHHPGLSPKQSYAGQNVTPPQVAGMSPRQRFPQPYPQRIITGASQYGSEMRCDQGQISPQGHIPRGQIPSPEYHMYNMQQGQVPRSYNTDPRQMMPGPQHYPYKGQGQITGPGVPIRHPGREYLYSPVKWQGQSPRAYQGIPQGMPMAQEQPQVQGQMADAPHGPLPPPAHAAIENGSQVWSHGGPSPHGQRSQYSIPQERLTPTTPTYPTHTAGYPMMHQYEKPYAVDPGHTTAPYSSVSQQTYFTAAGGQGQKNVAQNISAVGNQTSQVTSHYHTRNQNMSNNDGTLHVARSQNSAENYSSKNLAILANSNFSRTQTAALSRNQYQVTTVAQQQPAQRNQLVSMLTAGNQIVHSKRQMPARQSFVGNNTNHKQTASQGHQIDLTGEDECQQLLGNKGRQGNYSQQMVSNNRTQFSNQSNLQQPQQQQQRSSSFQKLPGNQGQTLSKMPSNQEGQGQLKENLVVTEVDDDDIPHLQQVHGSCVLCGKFSLYLCSNCKHVWYCSPACQMTHWQTHSQECRGDGT